MTEIQQRALRLARLSAGASGVAGLLATASWFNGSFVLYGINCVLLVACAACCFVNYRLAWKL